MKTSTVLTALAKSAGRITAVTALLATLLSAASPPAAAATPGARFILYDQAGEVVSDRHFQGRFMLVTFGYTFCPDVCPTNLVNMSAALDLLGADVQRIVPIFITVDPGRDTVEQLNGYVDAFHPALVGLTGSDEMIARVAKGYKVVYERQAPEPGSAADEYSVDHTASVFLMGPDGRFLVKFAHGMAPEAMARRIRDFF